ncbi:MAG TPA: ABC transporter permease [Gemmatimonadales bacterium]|nr:ABC transporter permease [Gemmatimonadales bacterium]
MSLWRQVTRGMRVLLNRAAADRDLGDEVQHYFEQATAAHQERGLSPAQARRAARVELGSVTAAQEQVRDAGWESVVGAVLADLRYAARRLRANPVFTAVSVLTLGLGIGATTAIFSAVNPVLFEPLPYPDPGRLVTISDVSAERTRLDVTFGTFRELTQRSRSFSGLAVLKSWQPTVTGTEVPERVDGQRVSAGYLRALGVGPMLGRDFDAADDRPNGPSVVILGHGLWHRRFDGDRSIVGRIVSLDDNPYTVIGVMPAEFENVLAPSAQLWAPLQYGESFSPESREWGHHLRMVGRLRPGVALGEAAEEVAAIARNPIPELARVPWASLQSGLLLASLRDEVTAAVRPALLAVLGAVVLLLTIACVNVTNLLLARGAQRRGEFAMRAALGAGRARLVRQLLTETLLLALLGGVAGLLVADIGVRALVALSPPGLPRLDAIRLDPAIFAFAFGLSALTGIMIGLVPAMQASRGGLSAGVQQSSRRSAGEYRRTRGTLVVAEVALALVLLVSAGLLLRSLERLFSISPGFEQTGLLTMQVQVTGHRFDADSVRNQFFERSLDAVREVPGVMAAAFTSQLPLSGDLDVYGVHLERDVDPASDGAALRYAVTPGYFQAMGIPLRAGRLLDDHDGAGRPRVVLVSESYAKRAFAGGEPIGRRLRFGPREGDWYTIVGVVGDVKQAALGLGPSDALYVSPAQWHWVDRLMSLVVRTGDEPASLAPAVSSAIWSVDKDQPIVRIATMRQLVERSAAERRFALIVFEAFGITALLLAATGIYGVLSGGVTERTREIGVRSALGASRKNILGLVVRQGMTLTSLGILLGVVGAATTSKVVVAMLFGVSPLDPATYVAVVLLLAAVSAIACWVPAARAARLDPSITLRAE